MDHSLARLTALGHVTQVAFVVRDLEKAIRNWAQLTGAGPFFRADFQPEHHYRGTLCQHDISVAFGYFGDTQLQLVQQKDDSPSIYQEVLSRSPDQDAFHHLLTLTDNLDAVIARYEELGIGIASLSDSPGMRVAFFDTSEKLGFLLEYFEMTPFFDEFFAKVHEAHVTWDGKDPIRHHQQSSYAFVDAAAR